MPPAKKPKQKQYCNKCNKDFKNGPHPTPPREKKKVLKKSSNNYHPAFPYLYAFHMLSLLSEVK